MGHDSENIFPKVSLQKIEEFLALIGAKKSAPNYYYYFQDEDYRNYQVIGITIDNAYPKVSKIYTRTTVFCSEWDIEAQNKIIRSLKERFGGNFSTNQGKNRYFRLNGENREKDEAGCYLAYESFLQILHSLDYYTYLLQEGLADKVLVNKFAIEQLGRHHPLAISAAMAIPFLISILERYFRDTYIALLRYRADERAFRKTSIHKSLNRQIAIKEISAYEAIAQGISFQNMNSITTAFADIDSRLNMRVILKEKYKKSLVSHFDYLQDLLNHRHQVIHHAALKPGYLISDLKADSKRVALAVKKLYFHLIKLYGWRKYS